MHRTTSRRGRWLQFLHRSAPRPPATEAELRDALWDLVASVHMNQAAAEDLSIRMMCRKAVRLMERGRQT